MHDFADKAVIGLTGGVASGKSETLKIFQQEGWEAIATDNIASELLYDNEEVREKVSSRWSSEEIFLRGSVDKSKIAEIIFNDPSERIWLEKLLHPLVRLKWITFIESSNARKFVVELPLLFEKNLISYFQKTICMYVPTNVQVSRMLNRGYSNKEANCRISSQMPSSKKIARADYVFLGMGSSYFLHSQVKEFIRIFTKL